MIEYQWIETIPLRYSSHTRHRCACPNGASWQESVAGEHDQGAGNCFHKRAKKNIRSNLKPSWEGDMYLYMQYIYIYIPQYVYIIFPPPHHHHHMSHSPNSYIHHTYIYYILYHISRTKHSWRVWNSRFISFRSLDHVEEFELFLDEVLRGLPGLQISMGFL